jgi:hypothetical protein
MKKRAYERIPTSIKIQLFCCKTEYDGTVMNLSEGGMLINVENMCFPFELSFQIFELSFQIIVLFKKEILKVPVEVTRIQLKPTSNDSIGVAITNPSKNYLEFVEYLKSVFITSSS